MDIKTAPVTAPSPIKDGTEASFMADVIEASAERSGHRRFLGAAGAGRARL